MARDELTSHVFFGESLIRGVRPKKKPKMYAKQSLAMTMEAGTKYQKIPEKMFWMIRCEITTTITSATCVQPNCLNWNL